MKILLALLLLTTLPAIAADSESFLHQAFCQRNNRESRISELEKISEDDKVVQFRMIFSHGLCDSIERVQAPIKFQKKMLQVTHYGFSYPGKKMHVRVETFTSRSDTELEAVISLEKSALQSKSSRRYIIDFWAGDYLGFPWVAKFVNRDGNIDLNFEGFERP